MDEQQIREQLETAGFLGQGWAFPVTFQSTSGTAEMVKGAEDIKQSLLILLGTALGERVLRADFGCNLENNIFDPLESGFQTLLTEIIRQAIVKYEPRISFDAIEIYTEPNEGRVEITVNYTISSTNTRSNIIYPFYLNEGTNVAQ
ncbi:MAG: GPW/gp25 family protein [Bacteroidetes bacterium]|nr:GPW/gp25 family protein [Bacteroidota bacterium]